MALLELRKARESLWREDFDAFDGEFGLPASGVQLHFHQERHQPHSLANEVAHESFWLNGTQICPDSCGSGFLASLPVNTVLTWERQEERSKGEVDGESKQGKVSYTHLLRRSSSAPRGYSHAAGLL